MPYRAILNRFDQFPVSIRRNEPQIDSRHVSNIASKLCSRIPPFCQLKWSVARLFRESLRNLIPRIDRLPQGKVRFDTPSASRDAHFGIAVLCTVQNFAYYGLMVWLPSYLGKSLGFSLTKSGLWTGVTVLGMACGTLVCGQLADRIGRKPVLIFFQVGAMSMVFLYSRITNPSLLLWVGAVMGLFVNGTNGAIFALMSEAYPTSARATAQNVLWNLARAVGALGPLVVGAITAKYSFQAAIGLLASIYLLDIMATIVLVPELKGKALE